MVRLLLWFRRVDAFVNYVEIHTTTPLLLCTSNRGCTRGHACPECIHLGSGEMRKRTVAVGWSSDSETKTEVAYSVLPTWSARKARSVFIAKGICLCKVVLEKKRG